MVLIIILNINHKLASCITDIFHYCSGKKEDRPAHGVKRNDFFYIHFSIFIFTLWTLYWTLYIYNDKFLLIYIYIKQKRSEQENTILSDEFI